MPDDGALEALVRSSTKAQVLEAVLGFTNAFDHRDASMMKHWLAPDGVWHRLVGAVHGHGGVDALIAGLTPGFLCRHVISNWSITLDDADTATCRCYMTVFRSDGPDVPAFPVKLDHALHAVGECVDTLVRGADGWRIASRRFSPIYSH